MEIPWICSDGSRKGICLGGKECFVTNIAFTYRCVIIVKGRLTLSFMIALKFLKDNVPSSWCVPRTDHSNHPPPFVTTLVTGFVRISFLEWLSFPVSLGKTSSPPILSLCSSLVHYPPCVLGSQDLWRTKEQPWVFREFWERRVSGGARCLSCSISGALVLQEACLGLTLSSGSEWCFRLNKQC